MTKQQAEEFCEKFYNWKMDFNRSHGPKEVVTVIGHGQGLSFGEPWVIFTTAPVADHHRWNMYRIIKTSQLPDNFYAFVDVKNLTHIAAINANLPKTDLGRYPHTCLKCSSPAYRGFSSFECSNERCK